MTDILAADELLLERRFDASPDQVFRIWSAREHLLRWWGPKDFTCTAFDLEFREGGAWRACIVSDSYPEIWMRGIYREIVPGRRLVFSFIWEDDLARGAPETLVTVTFEADGRGTRQRFHQAPFRTAEGRDSHLSGWGECFDREATYLARSED